MAYFWYVNALFIVCLLSVFEFAYVPIFMYVRPSSPNGRMCIDMKSEYKDLVNRL